MTITIHKQNTNKQNQHKTPTNTKTQPQHYTQHKQKQIIQHHNKQSKPNKELFIISIKEEYLS